MKFWRLLSAASYIFGWFTKAAADGKLTLPEITEAITHLADMLGFEVEIELPPPEAGEFAGTVRPMPVDDDRL